MADPTFLAGELAKARGEARLARKKAYRRLVGLGIGGAGVLAMLAGLPLGVSLGLWIFAAASWAILKAV